MLSSQLNQQNRPKSAIQMSTPMKTGALSCYCEKKTKFQLNKDLIADHSEVWEQNLQNYEIIAGRKNIFYGQNSEWQKFLARIASANIF